MKRPAQTPYQKLLRPPHVPHWARYNFPDLNKTTGELLKFAKSFPTYTYAHAMKLLDNRMQLHTDWETLLKSADRDGRENSRGICRELLEAFRNFESDYDLEGFKAFDFELFPWSVSKDVRIPVKPLTTLLQRGRLEPVFVFGWASFPLDRYRTRLLMTVIEDAVFSLEDYQMSSGHFIILPRQGKNGKRKAEVWHRGDHEILKPVELREQVDIYLEALEAVKSMLGRESTSGRESLDSSRPAHDPRQLNWLDSSPSK